MVRRRAASQEGVKESRGAVGVWTRAHSRAQSCFPTVPRETWVTTGEAPKPSVNTLLPEVKVSFLLFFFTFEVNQGGTVGSIRCFQLPLSYDQPDDKKLANVFHRLVSG